MAGSWRYAMVGAAVIVGLGALALAGGRLAPQATAPPDAEAATAAVPRGDVVVPVVKTNAEWQKQLTPQQYSVLREAGTESAFTGKYWNNHAKGTYVCAACGLELFTSGTKYDSGTGWPSFWQPVAQSHVTTNADEYKGQGYTEVKCARCGGHLGHVFDDGPRPTGQRYCMNSVALKFIPSR